MLRPAILAPATIAAVSLCAIGAAWLGANSGAARAAEAAGARPDLQAVYAPESIPAYGSAYEPAIPGFEAMDAAAPAAARVRGSDLLQAAVVSADGRETGRVTRIVFGADRRPQWALLRFDGGFGDWTLRVPVSSLSPDPADGTLRVAYGAGELRRMANSDPESRARTATMAPARGAPAARLMGLEVVDKNDALLGRVHSVRVGQGGAVESFVIERRNLLGMWTQRRVVAAEMASYLPVSQRLLLHDRPQMAALEASEG